MSFSSLCSRRTIDGHSLSSAADQREHKGHEREELAASAALRSPGNGFKSGKGGVMDCPFIFL